MISLNKDVNVNSTKELTKELADAIVQDLLVYGTVKSVFTADSTEYDYKNIVKVDKEVDRVASLIKSMVSGSFVVEPSVPATYDLDEEGNQVEVTPYVPAVYYKVTTESKLLNDIDSFLTVKPLLDYLKGDLTWTAYKDSFKVVLE